jgi:hypothetical protein
MRKIKEIFLWIPGFVWWIGGAIFLVDSAINDNDLYKVGLILIFCFFLRYIILSNQN